MTRFIAGHRYNGLTLVALGLALIASVGCEGLAVRDARSLLFEDLCKSEVWGFIAGFGTTFAAVPDLVSMFKRRSSTGMHPRIAGILAVFQVIWIYYGLLISSRPVIAWNVIAFVINSFSVAAFVYFVRRERARLQGSRVRQARDLFRYKIP